MRAAMVTEFGGPEVIEIREVADPAPGAGQVLIDVTVADVLFLDTMLRSGAGQDHFPLRPPYVPGAGVAGTVHAVGFGADPALVGHRVVAHTGQGGYAEQAVVDVTDLVPLPRDRDLRTGAALLHDGITALALADATGIGPETSVLVLGASGGLGVASVQLAHSRGAHVVATGREPKLDRIRLLGADVVVDTGRPGWAEGIGPFDVVLDNIGGELGRAAFDLVAPGGRFSAHGTPSGSFTGVTADEATARRITVHGITDVQFEHAELRRLTVAALAEPALQPVIGQTFPLAKAAEAHRAIAERTVFGKTLLTV